VLKQFLRYDTSYPYPERDACVEWLRGQAISLGLQSEIVFCVPGVPILIMSRHGADPTLPSIVLNCHIDVVPAEASQWSLLPAGQTPFSAYEDGDGRIFGRGIQDMKSVGVQYLVAMSRLRHRRIGADGAHCVDAGRGTRRGMLA